MIGKIKKVMLYCNRSVFSFFHSSFLFGAGLMSSVKLNPAFSIAVWGSQSSRQPHTLEIIGEEPITATMTATQFRPLSAYSQKTGEWSFFGNRGNGYHSG